MPVHVVDAGAQHPIEISVGLEILLCYPAWSAERRARMASARCHQMVREWIRLEPARSREIGELFPAYALPSSRVSLETLGARRRSAQYAGYAFLPLLKLAEEGELPILAGKHVKLSRNAIGEWIWPDREDGNEIEYRDRLHNNLKRRIRPWDPVAHLAAAFGYVAKERADDANAVPYDPQDLEFHHEIVVRAQRYAQHIRAIPELKTVAGKLIDIEWRK